LATRIHIGRLTGKALAIAAGRGSVVGAQFAANLLLVRWWTPDQFGTFHEIRVFVGIALLLELGLPTGLLQLGGERDEAVRDLTFNRAVSLSGILGLAALAAFVVAGIVVGGADAAYALPAAGLLVAANVPAAALESVLVVRDRHRAAGTINAITALGSLAGVAAMLVWHPTLTAVYGALAAGSVARLVAYHALSGVTVRPAFAMTRGMARLVRTSLGVSASRLLGLASASVDRIVVMGFFSTGMLGVYVAGAWEVPFMAVFFGAITSAIVPEMSAHWSAGRNSDTLDVWLGAVRRAAWIVLPLFVWAWLWSPELIRVLFTDTYEDAVPVFRAYLAMLPLRVAVYSALLVAIGEVRVLVTGAAIDVIVNVAVSLVLASTIGLVGPAIATAFGTWVQITYYLAFVKHRMAVPLRRLLPWRDVSLAFTLSVGAMALTLAVRGWFTSEATALLASGAAGATLYAALAYPFAGALFVRRSHHAG